MPNPILSKASPCQTCTILPLTTKNFAEIPYGPISSIKSRSTTCPICAIILDLLPTSEPIGDIILRRVMDRNAFYIRDDIGLTTPGRERVIRGTLNYYYPGDDMDAILPWIEDTSSVTAERSWGREGERKWDVEKTKRAIERCNTQHERCGSIRSVRSARPTVESYFVDIVDDCVVYRDTDIRYVAVSYVWGRAPISMLNSSSLDALTKLGGLSRVFGQELSPMFKDLVEVARLMGERYLWIDALCIPQDGKAEKARLIQQMDVIYTQAYLTVFALSADNAQASLPGVGKELLPHVRCAKVQAEEEGSDENVQPTVYAALRPDLYEVLGNRIYNTRGWTFQETCFSKTSIVFMDHEIYFYCDSGKESNSGMTTPWDYWTERDLLGTLHEKREPAFDTVSQYHMYTDLLFAYTKRELSYPGDALNAITGILKAFSNQFKWKFVAGMPSHLLDRALLWRSAVPDQKRNRNFPSWSWAGWTGQSHWSFQDYLDAQWVNPVLTEFYHVELKSELESLQVIDLESEDQEKLSGADAVEEKACVPKLRFTADSVRMENFQVLPGKEYLNEGDNVPLEPYNEVWTKDGLRCGILYDWEGGGDAQCKIIPLSRYAWLCVTRTSESDVPMYETETSWFKYICDADKFEHTDYCLVNVMVLKTTEIGTERGGIGRIHQDVWRKLEKTRETKELQ